MPRRTKHHPERGDARTRLLEAARDVIRAQGFAASSVDDLCKAAGVTKGAFFHHFENKEALRRRPPLGGDHLGVLRACALP